MGGVDAAGDRCALAVVARRPGPPRRRSVATPGGRETLVGRFRLAPPRCVPTTVPTLAAEAGDCLADACSITPVALVATLDDTITGAVTSPPDSGSGRQRPRYGRPLTRAWTGPPSPCRPVTERGTSTLELGVSRSPVR